MIPSKYKKILMPILLLAGMATAAIAAWNNPVDTTVWNVNNFFQSEQWRLYGRAIEFFLFFVIFTAIYYIGGSWAMKKQAEAGAKRAITALAAALGGITTIALMSFTDNAMALLFPFAKNLLFFLMCVVVYALLLKLGMEEKKVWAAILAFAFTFMMFNLSNWFICEFQPDTSGPNPEDTDNRCPITDVIWENFRPDFGASGGAGDWWNSLWGGGGGEEVDPDKDPDDEDDGKPQDGDGNIPAVPSSVGPGSTLTGYWYINSNDFAYYGVIDKKNPLTFVKKTRAHQNVEKGVIRVFSEQCEQSVEGNAGEIRIKIQTNEHPNSEGQRNSLASNRLSTLKGFAKNHDSKEELLFNPTETPQNRWYKLTCKDPSEDEDAEGGEKCGDGEANRAEEDCDDPDMPQTQCNVYDAAKYSSGKLTCYEAGHADECKYNLKDCELIKEEFCGDGIKNLAEECDPGSGIRGTPGYNPPAPGNYKLCESLDSTKTGTLTCRNPGVKDKESGELNECTYDRSDCKDKEDEEVVPPTDGDDSIWTKWWFWLGLFLLIGGIYLLGRYRHRVYNNIKRWNRKRKRPDGGTGKILVELKKLKKEKEEHRKNLSEAMKYKAKFIRENVLRWYQEVIRMRNKGKIDLANYWLPHSEETSRVDEFADSVHKLRKEQRGHMKNLTALAKTEGEYWRWLDYLSRVDGTPRRIREILLDTERDKYKKENDQTYGGIFEISPMDVAADNHDLTQGIILWIMDVFRICARLLKYVSQLIGDNNDSWNEKTVYARLVKGIRHIKEMMNIWETERRHERINAHKIGKERYDVDLEFTKKWEAKYNELREEISKVRDSGLDKSKLLDLLGRMVWALASPTAIDKLPNENPNATNEEKEAFAQLKQQIEQAIAADEESGLHDRLTKESMLLDEIKHLAKLAMGMNLQITQLEKLIEILKPAVDEEEAEREAVRELFDNYTSTASSVLNKANSYIKNYQPGSDIFKIVYIPFKELNKELEKEFKKLDKAIQKLNSAVAMDEDTRKQMNNLRRQLELVRDWQRDNIYSDADHASIEKHGAQHLGKRIEQLNEELKKLEKDLENRKATVEQVEAKRRELDENIRFAFESFLGLMSGLCVHETGDSTSTLTLPDGTSTTKDVKFKRPTLGAARALNDELDTKSTEQITEIVMQPNPEGMPMEQARILMLFIHEYWPSRNTGRRQVTRMGRRTETEDDQAIEQERNEMLEKIIELHESLVKAMNTLQEKFGPQIRKALPAGISDEFMKEYEKFMKVTPTLTYLHQMMLNDITIQNPTPEDISKWEGHRDELINRKRFANQLLNNLEDYAKKQKLGIIKDEIQENLKNHVNKIEALLIGVENLIHRLKSPEKKLEKIEPTEWSDQLQDVVEGIILGSQMLASKYTRDHYDIKQNVDSLRTELTKLRDIAQNNEPKLIERNEVKAAVKKIKAAWKDSGLKEVDMKKWLR